MSLLISRLRRTAGALLLRRHFSAVISPESKSPSNREVLAILKAENNPRKIIDIFAAVNLSPVAHFQRVLLSTAVFKLSSATAADAESLDLVAEFIDGLVTRPELRTEKFLSNAIVLFGQARMVSHAVRTFDRSDELGVARSVALLNSLIMAYIIAKDFQQVPQAFVELTKLHRIKPNLDTYNLVIQAFSESGSTGSGLPLLTEMETKGIKPNTVTFNNLLAGFYAEERLDEVERVLALMKQHGVPHVKSVYNARILGLCKLGRTSEAAALVETMVSEMIAPNSATYRHLIHGFCMVGDLSEAKKVWASMGRLGLKPESQCYFMFVHFLIRGGDFEAALEVAKESMANNWVPNFSTMKDLANGLASVGKVGEAREIVAAMKDKFDRNVDAWNEVEAGLSQSEPTLVS